MQVCSGLEAQCGASYTGAMQPWSKRMVRRVFRGVTVMHMIAVASTAVQLEAPCLQQ